MKSLFYWCACIFGMWTQLALAADGNSAVRLCIQNGSGIQVMLYKPGVSEPVELARKDGNHEVRIRGRETLKIEVCDYNPLLFSVDAGELSKSPLPDAAAGEQFAKAVTDLGQVLKAATGGILKARDADKSECSLEVTSIEGVQLQELSLQVTALVDFHGKIPERIELTQARRQPAPASNPTLDEAKKTVATEAANVLKMRAAVARLSGYSLARLANRPMQIEYSSEGGTHSATLRPGSALFDDADCARPWNEHLQEKLQLLQFIASERATLSQMLEVVEKFSVEFAKVGNNVELASIGYDKKNRQSQTFTFVAQKSFDKFLSSATQSFVKEDNRLGKVTINVEPQLDLRMAIAPGVIYSFVKQQKFSAKAADGAFTIAAEESEYTAASGIVALNITRDKYSHENVRPFVQLGVSPKKDELAFLLGVGIALEDYDNAVISVGAIYQERSRLVDGLSVGSTIATAEDLKLDQEFKLGFYVGLSYNIEASK